MIEVRHALPEDAEALAEANIRSIREICGASGAYTPEQIAWWVENKVPTNYLKWMANSDLRLYTGLVDGAIAGVGMVDIDEGEIQLLYLVPEAQGRGLGAELLQTMEDEARFLGLGQMRLNSTVGALSFYARHGYRNLGPEAHPLPSFRMEKDL